MTIPLIEKTDSFEQIRDKVALILATETALQQALATTQGKDPAGYKFRVYSERSNPFDSFLQPDSDRTPIVNVFYDGSIYDKDKSNVSDRQQGTSTIQIDCLAYAQSVETQTGHTPGDEYASRAVQGVARLVRNIIMHDDNKYLQFARGVVARRWIRSISAFSFSDTAMQKIRGMRLTLEVDHLETAMIADENTIDFINIEFRHASDGEIIAKIDYNLE